MNTPRAIIDPTRNAAVWNWDLTGDAFGAHAANDDVDGDGIRYNFNLRYPGQYFDAESGLHYNYFRDYEPQTGRYVESDPIGLAGGVSTYGYVGGNALAYTDERGLLVRGQGCTDRQWQAIQTAEANVRKNFFNVTVNAIKTRAGIVVCHANGLTFCYAGLIQL